MAAIFSSAPVLGLRPILAFLSFTENVPKPTNLTLSPSASESEMALIMVSTAAAACYWVIPIPATFAARSAFVIFSAPFNTVIQSYPFELIPGLWVMGNPIAPY